MVNRIVYASAAFGRKAKKFKRQEKKELDNAVLDILKNPDIGEEKAGDLAGVFVHKFKVRKQLILLSYTYDKAEINLLTLGSHENFYRDLKNYRKA